MDPSDVSVFSEKDFMLVSFSAFEDMREKGELLDCKIAVQKRSISAHRLILAARIPLFRKLIACSARGVIKVQEEIDPDILESVINFAYTGVIRITTENVRPLLAASTCLQVTQVLDACWEFLAERISPSNVWQTRELADDHQHLTLVETCDGYIRKNFEVFCESESFLTVPFPYLDKVVNSDDVKITGAEITFEAIIKWVKVSPPERSDSLLELLKAVRMVRLSPEYLIDRVSTEELVRLSIPCRDLVDEAKHYHLLQGKKPKPQSFTASVQICEENSHRVASEEIVIRSVPCLNSVDEAKHRHLLQERTEHRSFTLPARICEDKSHRVASEDTVRRSVHCRNLVDEAKHHNLLQEERPKHQSLAATARICEGNSQRVASTDSAGHGIYAVSNSCVKSFDSEKAKWITLSTRSFPCAYHVVAFAGKIYVLCKTSTEILDLKTLQWLSLYTVHGSLDSAGVLLHDDLIYSFGGKGNLSQLVRRFDLHQNVWITVGQMRSCRMFSGVASLKERIYVTGGIRDGDICNSVEQYVPKTKRWCSVAPMLCNRCDHGCTSFKGKIYVCGGFNETCLNTAEVYDPWTNQWNKISSMKEPKVQCSFAAYNGKLYALGRWSLFDRRAVEVEIYDPELSEWKLGIPVSENDNCDEFLVLTATPTK